jgi:uncharacterized protein (DUF1778 family)
MPGASERIVIQVTPAEKELIVKRAGKARLNVSEFMRRAAKSVRNAPEDEELLALLGRAEKAARESMAMIDETLAFVAASNKRIAKLESRRAR